jgi:hypothetical protein
MSFGDFMIQRKQLLPQPLGIGRHDFSPWVQFGRIAQHLKSEALYHPYSAYYRYTSGDAE